MEGYWIALIVIACIIALILLFKLYLILNVGWNNSPTCLVGKTVIVTGANTGIGFYTAQDFATRGARVILACRDPIRAEEAKTKIIEATGNPNVIVQIVDLGSLASVRKFAVAIKATEERLDILVNNAGSGFLEYKITADGLSLSMQVNYFGPFLLTLLLLDLLKRSAPSRIVNVSSNLAKFSKLNIDSLNAPPGPILKTIVDYGNTKICLILFANELARKLKGTGVDANSLHPGAVQTDIFRDLSNFSKRMLTSLAKMFYKTTEEGAQTSIYLAVSKEVSGISGQYFIDCKKVSMPKVARDINLASKLWEKSVELVKLSPEDQAV